VVSIYYYAGWKKCLQNLMWKLARKFPAARHGSRKENLIKPNV